MRRQTRDEQDEETRKRKAEKEAERQRQRDRVTECWEETERQRQRTEETERLSHGCHALRALLPLWILNQEPPAIQDQSNLGYYPRMMVGRTWSREPPPA
jgi:hypothetical protein